MSELTRGEIRNSAICLVATDAALGDGMAPEEAVAYARRLEQALDTEPWANGKHSGDCTKQAHTCIRCMIEEAEAEARQRWNEPASSPDPIGRDVRGYEK